MGMEFEYTDMHQKTSGKSGRNGKRPLVEQSKFTVSHNES
jgi:hypothetical protein